MNKVCNESNDCNEAKDTRDDDTNENRCWTTIWRWLQWQWCRRGWWFERWREGRPWRGTYWEGRCDGWRRRTFVEAVAVTRQWAVSETVLIGDVIGVQLTTTNMLMKQTMSRATTNHIPATGGMSPLNELLYKRLQRSWNTKTMYECTKTNRMKIHTNSRDLTTWRIHLGTRRSIGCFADIY